MSLSSSTSLAEGLTRNRCSRSSCPSQRRLLYILLSCSTKSFQREENNESMAVRSWCSSPLPPSLSSDLTRDNASASSMSILSNMISTLSSFRSCLCFGQSQEYILLVEYLDTGPWQSFRPSVNAMAYKTVLVDTMCFFRAFLNVFTIVHVSMPFGNGFGPNCKAVKLRCAAFKHLFQASVNKFIMGCFHFLEIFENPTGTVHQR